MASGGTPSTNRVFLFRLQTLIVDGGTFVLRNMFHQRLPNVALNVYFAMEKTPINRLRGQKIITAQQYNLLYPQSGQVPNSSDFDITLIICLLKSLKSLGLNRQYNWNAIPQPADTSVEADLCRLKGFRNEVAHISSTVGIQPLLFQTKWTEIEQVLLRLNSAVPNPDPTLKQTIDSYKNDPLDPVAEQRMQKEIGKWRTFELGLETEMLMIKKDVKELNKSVDEVSVEVKVVEIDVLEVSEEVQKVDKGVTKMSEEVKKVQKDVIQVNEEVQIVDKGVKKVSEEVKDVGKNVLKVSEEVQIVDRGVKKVNEDVKEVEKDVIKVNEDVQKVDNSVTKVSVEIKEVKTDVLKVSEEVQKVDKGLTKVSKDVKEVENNVINVNEVVKEVGKDVLKVSEDVQKVDKGVTNVSEKVKEVERDVLKVSVDVQKVDKGVTKVSEEVKEVAKDVIIVSENVQKVDKGVTKVSEEVQGLRKDFIQVSEEVKDVAKDVSIVSESITEVREMRQDVKELKQHVDVLNEGFSKLESNTQEDAVSDSRGQKKNPGILKRVKNFFSSRKSRRLKEPLSGQVETPVLGEDAAYLKMKTDLQDDLISFYRRQHRTIL